MQKFPKAGRTEVAPMPKARRSVTDVMVIATPECFIAKPILSSTGRLWIKLGFNSLQTGSVIQLAVIGTIKQLLP